MLNLRSDTRKKNVGFVELPDEELDILNYFARQPDWEVALVVSLNEQSYAVRMADVLQIPVMESGNRLSLSSCDYLVVGSHPQSLLGGIVEMMEGTGVKILTLAEAHARIRAAEEPSIPSEEGVLDDEMVRPGRITRPVDSKQFERPKELQTTGTADWLSVKPQFDAGTLLGDDFKAKLESLPLDIGEDKLLREILSLAVQATHAQTGSIMLLDRDGEHLRIAAAEGLPGDIVANTRRRVGEGVSGKVFLRGEPVLVRGRVAESDNQEHRPRLREAACVPIMNDQRPIGVLNVNVESEETALTEESLKLLMRFAREASGAIIQALDLKDVQGEVRREALLRQVDKLLSLRDAIPARMRAIGEALRNTTRADFVHVYMVDPLGRRLELISPPQGSAHSGGRFHPMDRGTLGWVSRHGSIQHFELVDERTGHKTATVYMPVRTAHPHAVLVLENLPTDSQPLPELLALFKDVLQQITEFISVEEGVDAQELLNQLNLRVADQRAEFMALPMSQRARAILEFTTQLLAAESALWVPESGRPVSTRPKDRRAAELLERAREDSDTLVSWIESKGAAAGGAVAPGWDSRAPRGPAPWIGVAHPRGEGALLVFFSPSEETGSPAQVPPHVLFEVLLHVVGLIPEALNTDGEADRGTFTAK